MLKKPPQRMGFSKKKEIVDLPNLIEIQIKSYAQFLQANRFPNERENVGLQEVFNEIFPIESYDEKTILEYLSYSLGASKYSPEECIRRGITYNVTLKVKFRLTDETGIKEEEVYMGTIPLMTDKGTFIINGAERVVVSQLHRSPGICFEKTRHPRGMLYSFRIIPYRGSWLEGALDANDLVYIYIDRKKRRRKVLATTFIRALGFSTNADIIEEFFQTKKYKVKSERDFAKLVGKILAADVTDAASGLVFGRAAEKLTTAMLKRMFDAGIDTVLLVEDAEETHPIIKMLLKDPTDSYEAALKDFYRKLRPGEPATIANARSAMMRLFFDPKRYNLGRVGRYKIHSKLGLPVTDEVLQHVTLTKEDVIGALKYLMRLRDGDDAASIDDIDHLGNRRVRSVGELIQNQCRIGLARMEKIVRERVNIFDFSADTLTPGKIVSAKGLTAVLKDFFGRSQLSQFMDQTNPIAELTHKRRLSALGPGGLNRDRAGFEVRDVHPSHYGRICPIETPEGPNIGLITSLSSFAKINEFGFIETPYRVVRDGVVTDEIAYMTADQEERCVIAQASAPLDAFNMFENTLCWAHFRGETIEVDVQRVTHMDVSPKQLVSIVTGLIPFLEHDDANRALMGSNMQRQGVPLLVPEAPIVGTGLEARAARDSGAVVVAQEEGIVDYVDGQKIIVSAVDNPLEKRTYHLKKFMRSNMGTCINQRPLCSIGDRIAVGDVVADGPATDCGEIALGKNVLVAFMPWMGYNFEDAIIISERLLKRDTFTSVHILEFTLDARETKLGAEEVTRDIPNVSEEILSKLGPDGVILVGSEVKAGDILVGKITPESDTELAPEERLLRAIFGEKAKKFKDASLIVPPGVEGVVTEVKVFGQRDGLGQSKKDDEFIEEAARLKELHTNYKDELTRLKTEKREKMAVLLLDEPAPATIVHRRSADVILLEGTVITEAHLNQIENENMVDLMMPQNEVYEVLKDLLLEYNHKIDALETRFRADLEQLRKGDTDLGPGVIRQVRVYIASKRKLEVGDKMAGRHGNKGVVAKIVPEADMPYMADGTPIEIILNPLGVTSRMNMGQLFETHLGYIAKFLGFQVKSPVFEGFPEEKIWEMMRENSLPEDGKFYLYDGRTGERFDNPSVVGQIYMLKLGHLVADKIHARAIGPYSLVTQQPLGGKAQMGGQRFGEMEVWAAEAYGAAYTLSELLTVKSDDVGGRSRIYEAIVKGENILDSRTPESFNVLVKEMQGLGLDVRPEWLGAVEEKKDGSQFDFLTIKIASPDVVRNEWSYGEVKKPETVNYRTVKPEKGGLLCEKIFGPTRDWECSCGKYKKIKNKGIVCDRCGVEVTLSKVRRERMAHIDLAVPVVHIWFFKSMPSHIGNVLGMTASDLERVIYYEQYVVVESSVPALPKKQLLTEMEYRDACEKWGSDAFVVKMGGEAIQDLLATEDLPALLHELKEKLRKTKSMQARIKLAKRLKIIESFVSSPNKPEWMVLNAVPVIPPDLRPLVPLDGGRFATSDLNDLYRRVINRNNRLRAILKLKTPEVIVRNEKRMLQEAVDALFDNGRRGQHVTGAGGRPLKSLSDMLKGKQGRFRQNLLGKRVDYSGRSVIIVGPELKFNQCGLPKVMALELFEPFIVKRIKDLGYVYTVRSAKKMIQRQAPEVWDVLEEIIKGHSVMLNRAPTLHRLGIQAFEPVLIEGRAIRIHPLVCSAFNADFDGDQMAVYVPLSVEAQLEAKLLMMASDNIFLPSSGKPAVVPSQEMTLGLYYLMCDPIYDPEAHGKKLRCFANSDEVLFALSASDSHNWSMEQDPDCELDGRRYYKHGIHVHERIKLRTENGIVETTPGRVIFNSIIPKALGFQNYNLPKKRMSALIVECYNKLGLEETVAFIDRLKSLGFSEATKSGISLGVCDVLIPSNKQHYLDLARKRVEQTREQYEEGIITDGERSSKVISIWTEVDGAISEELFTLLSKPNRFRMNPVFQMLDSGARGTKSQIKQLGAQRGLMAKPTGEIIESPITSNFREGLTVAEFFISAHGARKGLADTALKTADSGYLTRRLVDVAQVVTVTKEDCGTFNGIEVSAIKQGQEELLALKDRLIGRTSCEDIYLPGDSTKLLAQAGDLLSLQQAQAIDDAGIETVRIRSALTCEMPRGICAYCYGISLASGSDTLIGCGEAVGIIAAQSIGEPGTQLTMRTFHFGGIASASVIPEAVAEQEGILLYSELRTVRNKEGQWIVLNKNGRLDIVRNENRSIDEYKRLLASRSIEPLQSFNVELGTRILLSEGHSVRLGELLAEWEQHNIPIICDRPGYVRYEDLVEGISTQRDENRRTGQVEIVVKQHQGKVHPQIVIYADRDSTTLVGTYPLPAGAILSVQEGDYAEAGMLLARLPRAAMRTKDITGGLPRVAELVEARKPRDAAEIAKIEGVVDFSGVHKHRRSVVIRDEKTGVEEEHLIPLTKHLIVQKGDHVVKGQQLTEGVVIPHEILDVCGVRELQKYLVNQVQEVYRLQGVDINDKHIEIIVRQMLQKVRVLDTGDTNFLVGEEVDRKEFEKANKVVLESGGKAAQATPLLLGITKASLSTESWVSAAAFQDTPRVLTAAAAAGQVDYLRDPKSNVIVGHMVPIGTGFSPEQFAAFDEGFEPFEINFDDDLEEEALLSALELSR